MQNSPGMSLMKKYYYYTRNFRQGRYILYEIFNIGQKISVTKISPMNTRAGGEIGEIFLLAKISTYTVFRMQPIWKIPLRNLSQEKNCKGKN